MKIRNCTIEFRCPKTWEALITTASPDVRYCGTCDRGVHLCKTESELAHANALGWCVAVQLDHETSTTIDYRPHGDDDALCVGLILAPYAIDPVTGEENAETPPQADPDHHQRLK